MGYDKNNFYLKRTVLIVGVIVLILSCNRSKKNVPLETIDDKPAMEEVEVPVIDEPVKEIPDVPLGFLVLYEGKYAAQEQLFLKDVLANRLNSLDRFNYKVLLQNYNTETPIVIVDDIVNMSGCKQHDCPSSAYDFFIDLNNDNINIYHFRQNMLRLYQEKGMIELPEEFVKEMEIKKSNAGIGNTESIESKYAL